jgi:uncharacterized protein
LGTVPSFAVRSETVTLTTSDGLALSGHTSVPAEPVGALVMCHPHPLYGGDMDNPVVMAVARSAEVAGFATVRFDFRGVRGSEGEHGDGVTEALDVQAALDVAETLRGGGPLVLAGYSFGALVALSVVDERITRWIVIAPPIGRRSASLGAVTDPRPKRLIGPEHDQFTSVDTWHEAGSTWTNTSVATVPMADHFMNGHLSEVARLALSA